MNTEQRTKQLSSPFSTGGGGHHFEAHIQASFVVLMLTGGFVPCLPCCPIEKIKLQAKVDGYETDDIIVFLKNLNGGQQQKLIAQVKRSISITESDEVFCEVIQSAWKDFNNAKLFTKRKDAIALITGPLSANDIEGAREILEWARHTERAEEFLGNVQTAKLSSDNKRKKLAAFRRQLDKANGGNAVSDGDLYEFLRHFHLLSYDLDIKSGVALSLLHSLIGQYSLDNVYGLWARLVEEVQAANKNAGTITKTSLPEDLVASFKRPAYSTIPQELASGDEEAIEIDWNAMPYASNLAIANLIGAWNENDKADVDTISEMVGEDYSSWIHKLQEVLQSPNTPLSIRNGKWHISNRLGLLQSLGSRLFDKDLDSLHLCAVRTLTDSDPKFDLPAGDRFAASIYGKTLSHSQSLRRGLAEGLALIGTHNSALKNCSQDKGLSIAILSVREIFANADWVRWGSLNDLLPFLAEAAPEEFLRSVEQAVASNDRPFETLFQQEVDGITGEGYLTGLLWALESLAWDEKLVVRVCVILSELAERDPGGRLANRPFNSLVTILIPWMPQTTASVEKRKVALQTIQKESPDIAWKLLLALLPGQHESSTGSYKPKFRQLLSADLNSVTQQEYWQQVSSYAEMAVEIADNDLRKLSELVQHITSLTKPTFEKLLKNLSSETIRSKPENERLELWRKLTEVVARHTRFANAKWALNPDAVSELTSVASKLAPNNPINFYHRLFGNNTFELYDGSGTWEEKRIQLEQKQREAVETVLNFGGIEKVIEFASSVDVPGSVGYALGLLDDLQADSFIFPGILSDSTPKLLAFGSGYVRARLHMKKWSWTDTIDFSAWKAIQVGMFLSLLPFVPEVWDLAERLLGDSQEEYWTRVNPNPYETDSDMGRAVDALMKYGRPAVAVACLSKAIHMKQPVDVPRIVKALLAVVDTEEDAKGVDSYEAIELIKALQNEPSTDGESLFRIEWQYLQLLDRATGAPPKTLEHRLSSDPEFFCELIRCLYRSNKEAQVDTEPTPQEKRIARNAYTLLKEWQTPPGILSDGTFSPEQFKWWLAVVTESCTESGHLEVAYGRVGCVLFYAPADPNGLWIDRAVAEALNEKHGDKLRQGFSLESYNSRGVHCIDPTGKPEKDLAAQYRQKAEEVENAGFHRFAVTLREIAAQYEREAEDIVANGVGWKLLD